MVNKLIDEQNGTIYLARFISAIIASVSNIMIFIIYTYTCKKKKDSIERTINRNSSDDSWNSRKEIKKERQNFGDNMILIISIFHFIFCISTFILKSPYTEIETESLRHYLCIAQASLFTLSEISTVCLTTSLCFSVYIGELFQIRLRNKSLYIGYGIIPPLIISIIPLILNMYGQAGVMCSLKYSYKDSIFRYIFIGIILFCLCNVVANLYFILRTLYYLKSFYYFRAERLKSSVKSRIKYLMFLFSFSFILLICWLPSSLNSLYFLISKQENYYLLFVNAIAFPLIGFLNFVVYTVQTLGQYYSCSNPNDSISEVSYYY